MARDFNGSTDEINLGSASAIDDVSAFTWVVIFNPDSAGESSQGNILAKNLKFLATDSLNVTDGLLFYIPRATDPGYALSNSSLLSYGTWYVVCCTWDTTNGAKIYLGTLGGTLSEISYLANPLGSGTVDSDAAQNLVVGGGSTDSTVNYDGKIAEMAMYNRVLTLPEMQAIGKALSSKFIRRGQLIGLDMIRNVRDLRGNSTPSLTGTTVSDHPRIQYPSDSISFPISLVATITELTTAAFGFTASAIQNSKLVALTVAAITTVANAISSGYINTLQAASLAFTAASIQLSTAAQLALGALNIAANAVSGAVTTALATASAALGFVANTIQNSTVTTLTTAVFDKVVNSVTNTVQQVLSAAGLSFSAQPIALALVTILGAASFGFVAWAITGTAGAAAAYVATKILIAIGIF